MSVAGDDRPTVRVEVQIQAWARSLAQAGTTTGPPIHVATTNGGVRVAYR